MFIVRLQQISGISIVLLILLDVFLTCSMPRWGQVRGTSQSVEWPYSEACAFHALFHAGHRRANIPSDIVTSPFLRTQRTYQQHHSATNRRMYGFFGFSTKRQLNGRRIAILATQGVEQVELTSPRKALEKAGAIVELVSPHKLVKGGKIKAWNLVKWGDSFKIDVSLSQAKVSSYDGLHLPGGVINPDILRMDTDAVDFVRSFFEAGKPVSSICHGPWMLIEADVVQGRTLTSWTSLKTDLRNAGANWVNEEVVEDRKLVTSRGPQDLRAFNEKIIDLFATAVDSAEEMNTME